MMTKLTTAYEALKKYYGYNTFRPLQAEIIEAIYQKRDCLVLMPTGGGKSLCFQIPAITQEGVCVVVSPLISLMKDQVEALRQNGIQAAFYNSSLTSTEIQAVENQLFDNKLKLLYVSPEKLLSNAFLPILRHIPISLFAIDEAHCISSWGHDFRPEYTQMAFLKKQFPHIPIVALTATADKLTRRDIVQQLNMENPEIFITSFDRPNLNLEVRGGQKRIEQIISFILQHPRQSGIVYCLSRKSTEDVATKLNNNGIKAAFYHAQMPNDQKAKVQEDFLYDRVQVICATIAFGMGIDKPNVRFVIHYNLPKNMESYYQEIGRAGRDGLPSDTLLFYSMGDVMTYRDMFAESQNADLQNAKLDTMLQFADARICRRQILLNYFNENHEGNCQNCDVCGNPPQYFDGTKLAQMAFSAIQRLRQSVGLTMLIDVLRGSAKHELLIKGYDQIKTYGAGRSYTISEWRDYLQQFIQLGYLEIAHDDEHKIKLLPSTQAVLFEGKIVELVRVLTAKEVAAEKAKEQKQLRERTSPQLRMQTELLELLKALRSDIAAEKAIPAYLVFSDVTLQDMATKMPQSESEMLNVTGVGTIKMQTYGMEFLKVIQEFRSSRSPEGTKILGNTYQITFEMYQKGMPIEDIAKERGIQLNTILSHLAELYEKGEKIDIHRLANVAEVIRVVEAIKMQKFPEPFRLREIFDYFKEEVPYSSIRLGIAHHNRLMANG